LSTERARAARVSETKGALCCPFERKKEAPLVADKKIIVPEALRRVPDGVEGGACARGRGASQNVVAADLLTPTICDWRGVTLLLPTRALAPGWRAIEITALHPCCDSDSGVLYSQSEKTWIGFVSVRALRAHIGERRQKEFHALECTIPGISIAPRRHLDWNSVRRGV
jgi:hypothetical protein